MIILYLYLKQLVGKYLKIGHDSFLPHPFQSLIHNHTYRHSNLQNQGKLKKRP